MGIPARVNIYLCLSATYMCMLLIRTNISIALWVMTKPLPIQNGTIVTSSNDGLPLHDHWTPYQQSTVMGANYMGFSMTSFPIGILIDRFGHSKAYLQVMLCVGLVLTALFPLAARSFESLLFLQLCMGLTYGGIPATLQKLISCWSPPGEQGRFLTVLFGTDLGNILAWSLCGQLIHTAEWMYAFYGTVIILMCFFVIISYLVYDSPAKHPRIEANERDHIENSLINQSSKKWPPICSILTSLPFYSLLLLQYGHSWGMFFLLTTAPKFIYNFLGYELRHSTLVSSLPYIVRFIAGIGFGILGDHLKTIDWINQTYVRKLSCIFSHVLPAIILLGIPIVGNQPQWCIFFITVSYGFNGAIVMTSMQNAHELAPNYSATLYAIMEAFAATTGFIIPYMVTGLTSDMTVDEWTHIFGISAAVYIFPALFFVMFGSAEVQPWNKPTVNESVGASKPADELTTDRLGDVVRIRTSTNAPYSQKLSVRLMPKSDDELDEVMPVKKMTSNTSVQRVMSSTSNDRKTSRSSRKQNDHIRKK